MGGRQSSIPIPSGGLGTAASSKRGSRASILPADESKKPAAAFGPGANRSKDQEATLSPQVNALHNKWRHVWLMSMDRRRKLQVNMSPFQLIFVSVCYYFLSVPYPMPNVTAVPPTFAELAGRITRTR